MNTIIHHLLALTRPLFVFDTETTGLNTETARIVELGFQQWTAEGMTKEYRTLINPGVPIPEAVVAVHHITDDIVTGCRECERPLAMHRGDAMLPGAPTRACEGFKPWPVFKQISASLANGFRDCDFAGKNVRFDLRILAAEMRRAGQAWSYAGARVIDADRLEQIAVPRHLSDLYEKYVTRPCDKCEGLGYTILDAQVGLERCPACRGTGQIGQKHEGAHGALSDVKASTVVIAGQLETHAALPRDLDALHELSWPGWLTMDGGFRMVNGVPTILFGKHRDKAMSDPEVNKPDRKGQTYWDWMLSADFGEDAKKLAADAKMGKYPEAK